LAEKECLADQEMATVEALSMVITLASVSAMDTIAVINTVMVIAIADVVMVTAMVRASGISLETLKDTGSDNG